MASWAEALRTKYNSVRARIAAQERASALDWEYVDRPPGWAYQGTTYSLSAPPGYELDPLVVGFIKSWCPDYVPCWEKKTFLPPYDAHDTKPETFVRHAIARYVRDPRVGVHVFPSMEIPPSYSGKIPNYLETVLYGPDDPRASDLPGAYLPLDRAQAERLRLVYDKFKDLSPKEYMRESVTVPLTRQDFAKARRLASEAAAKRYVAKGLTRYLKSASDNEVKEIICGEQEELQKTFVFQTPAQLAVKSLGSTPRRSQQ